MHTDISQEQLRKVVDRMTREITRKMVGHQLVPGEALMGDDLCTVYIAFTKGFCFGLALHTPVAVLVPLAESFLLTEDITPAEAEEAFKEYLNVLCGRIATLLFKTTGIASRFDVPAFYRGRFSPQGHREQFVLNYSIEESGWVQLVCHVPAPDAANVETDGAGQKNIF